MEQTGHWDPDENLSKESLLKLPVDRFDTVDFEQAKSDVPPFIREPDAVSLWNREFFTGLLVGLQVT